MPEQTAVNKTFPHHTAQLASEQAQREMQTIPGH